MKGYTVVVSAIAARDLEMAVAYLADTLKSPAAARKLLDEYDHMLASLAEYPLSHPLVQDDLLSYAGYRWAAFSSYVAFFTVEEQGKVVSIHRIAHEARSWMQLLR